MFTQAQKEAAVEHYNTHVRCISATMRALGKPGRATLIAWLPDQVTDIGLIVLKAGAALHMSRDGGVTPQFACRVDCQGRCGDGRR